MKKKTVICITACVCLLGVTACGQTQTNTAGANRDNYINIDYDVYGDGYSAASRIRSVTANDVELTTSDKDKLIDALKTCEVGIEDELPDEEVRSTISLYGGDGEKIGSIIKYKYSDGIYLKDADGVSALSGEEIREETDKLMGY